MGVCCRHETSMSNEVAAFKKLYGRIGMTTYILGMLGIAMFAIGAWAKSETIMGSGLGCFMSLVVLTMLSGNVEEPRHDDESSWRWSIARFLQGNP